MDICEQCKDWGRTITREEHPNAIQCVTCKRLTWPNLGVNCPAGMAVSFAMSNALRTLQYIEKQLDEGVTDVHYYRHPD